jgi:putative sigma-54 modulation protein
MKTEIRAKGINQPQDFQEHVERRVALELSRFSGKLSEIIVWLEDVNGPKGGVDKHCRVKVSGPGVGPIVAEGRDADMTSAISRAIATAGRAASRSLRRVKSRDLLASRSLDTEQ